MKKIILSALAFSVFGVYSQNVVFNDPALKQKIVAHDQAIVGGVSGPNISLIDTDLNGEISIVEAQAYTGRLYLNQNGSNFYTDLTGVEEFINITELFCQNNQMTSLDVSANTSLTLLDCEYNQITNLNLTNNTSLVTLNYSYNNLPNVNLTPLVNLVELVCDNSNIVNLDLSANVNLQRAICHDNLMTTLNVTNCVDLIDLHCYNNQLTTINTLTNVDMEEFYCYDNLMTSVNLTNNIALLYLGVSNNELSELDLATNINLSELNCTNNELAELDVLNNVNLGELYAGNNLITSLILSNATDGIYVQNNLLTSLDLSGNVNFWGLNCSDNELSFLNLANTGNTNVYELFATGNPDLDCIQVDDVTYSTTNWTSIDASTSFNINCPVLVSELTVTSQSAVYSIDTDGGQLQMVVNVLPLDATDDTYTWSVTNGTGAATIDVSGMLTATNNGTVTVKASANDGSGIEGFVDVTISNQTMASLNSNQLELSVSIYPNPTPGIVNFKTNEQIESIEIYNLIGEKICTYYNTSEINIVALNNGVYMAKVIVESKKSFTKKLIRK